VRIRETVYSPQCSVVVRMSVMQYAKKLALVDPKILDQLRVDREYKAIQTGTDRGKDIAESRHKTHT